VTADVIASKVLSSLRAKRSNLPSRHCEQSEAISLFVIASKAKQSQKHKDCRVAIAPRSDGGRHCKQSSLVIASKAKQSQKHKDCRVAIAPRSDGGRHCKQSSLVIASKAKQSQKHKDCRVAIAPRSDGRRHCERSFFVIASKAKQSPSLSLRAKRSNLPLRHCEQSEAISLLVIASKAKQSIIHLLQKNNFNFKYNSS